MGYETWTEERAAHFERMAQAGTGYQEIAAELRITERTARRYVARWRLGIPAVNPPSVRRRRGAGRPVISFAEAIQKLPEAERNRRRAGVIERAQRGWEVGRIADSLKIPVSMARAWLAEWEGPTPAAEAGPPVERPVAPAREYHPWPQVTMSPDDWPADVRFEDCPRAVRDVTGGRPRFTDGLRSYSGNAAAMCAY